MKMHPAIGYEMLKSIPGMAGVEEIVYSHHEFFDGRATPAGFRKTAFRWAQEFSPWSMRSTRSPPTGPIVRPDRLPSHGRKSEG
jgi:hypothetical protein